MIYTLLALALTIVTWLSILLTFRDIASVFQRMQKFDHLGSTRRFRIVMPPKYRPDKKYPLVIALHGYRDRGKLMELYSGLSNLARKESFIILYPEGEKQSWNGLFCCGWAMQKQTDDIGFISSLINHVEDSLSVDREQIYIVGYSNGGILTQRLIEELPDTFAAAAAVMSGAGSKTDILELKHAKTPLLIVNGDKDSYIPLSSSSPSSPGFSFISAQSTVELWQRHYSCQPAKSITKKNKTIENYSCSKRQLSHWIYRDTGHRWPEWRLSSPWSSVPNSTKEIWQFLTSNR